MTADAQSGSREERGAASAFALGRLDCAGRLLLALSLAVIGLGSLIEPWMAHELRSNLLLFSCHELTGAALIAAALGIAAGRKPCAWAPIAGAAGLLLAVPWGVYFYRSVDSSRDGLDRVAFLGVMLMLIGLARYREDKISRWFQAGRFVFAIAILACTAVVALDSAWMRSGFDMFHANYDQYTLFNSIWAWHYSLAYVFGPLAMIGSVLLLFRRPARAGAICLAAASILFLPLLFLYRSDDFCGSTGALRELLYAWALDLGVAGGALFVAAALRQPHSGRDRQSRLWAGVAGIFQRRRVRVATSVAASLLLVAIVLHGLIPFFFYEANSRGNATLGDLTARVYAAAYVPADGNSYWIEKLSAGIMNAAPAGRSCAAGDPGGCESFADFYRMIGWNWGRSWRFFAQAAAISAARCDAGDAAACFNLGVQYESGEGVLMDAGKAAALYQKACDGSVGDACTRLGDLNWYGIGVAENKPKGMSLLRKGCGLGSQWGCERLQYINKFEK